MMLELLWNLLNLLVTLVALTVNLVALWVAVRYMGGWRLSWTPPPERIRR